MKIRYALISFIVFLIVHVNAESLKINPYGKLDLVNDKASEIKYDTAGANYITAATVQAAFNQLGSAGALLPVVTVASATSKNKYLADFVCDTTADDVQLQAAWNALPAWGGTIEFWDGDFYPDTSIVLSQKAQNATVYFKGRGGYSTRFLIGNNKPYLFISPIADTTTQMTLKFEGFTVQGNDSTYNTTGGFYRNYNTTISQDLLAKEIFMFKLQGDAITMDNAWNFNLDHCIIEENHGKGVIIKGGRGDWKVHHSTFNFNSGNDIYVSDTASDFGINIDHNAFNISSDSGVACMDIRSIHNILDGNIIYVQNPAVNRTGIDLYNDFNILSNNHIFGAQSSAILTGIRINSGSDNNTGVGNLISLAGGTSYITDAGSNNAIQVNGKYGDGGVTNYSGFDSTGNLFLKGTPRITSGGQIYKKTTLTVLNPGANTTYVASQITGGVIYRDCTGANRSDTTDSAVNILAAIPNVEVGSSFELFIANNSDAAETCTVVGGSGVTITGNATIINGYCKKFLVYVTNAANAITMYSQGQITY